jgi:hypothetical protein
MRWVVCGHAVIDHAASTSQMGRFEKGALTAAANLTALADLSGRWIDSVRCGRRGLRSCSTFDSSVSPTYSAQERTVHNGQFACTCYHPPFLVKLGAKVVAHGRYLVFQMAEVPEPRELFRSILQRLAESRRAVVVRC